MMNMRPYTCQDADVPNTVMVAGIDVDIWVSFKQQLLRTSCGSVMQSPPSKYRKDASDFEAVFGDIQVPH